MPILADRIARPKPADPRKEYVSGGTLPWSERFYQSLPPYIDDITQDLGDDLYERMMLDPQVSSCVMVLKVGILAQGVQLMPALKEGDEGFEQAVKIRDFCDRALFRLRNLVTHTLGQMLDALMYGHQVAELVYHVAREGEDAGKLVLARMKVKPRRAYAFVVDPYANLVGLLAVIPGVAPTMLGGTIVGTPASAPNLLPPEKFAILTHRPKDDDPRGTSIGRPAYNAWWVKLQTWPELLKYLAQFAGPSLVGYTTENASPTAALNADGDLIRDEEGNPTQVDPQAAMLAALLEFRNGTAAVFPFGAKVDTIEPLHTGTIFGDTINLCDQQIAKAILGQTLATEQAEHQARAAAETHQDILGLFIRGGRLLVEEMLWSVLSRLVGYNWGPEAAALMTPLVSLGDVEQQDLAAMAKAVAALELAGFIAPSQRRAIDAMLGLPIRTAEEAESHAPPPAGIDREGRVRRRQAAGEEDGEEEGGEQLEADRGGD